MYFSDIWLHNVTASIVDASKDVFPSSPISPDDDESDKYSHLEDDQEDNTDTTDTDKLQVFNIQDTKYY